MSIVGWVRTKTELEWWEGGRAAFPPDVSLVRAWHREDGVHPYVLLGAGEPCGYGEIWEDPGVGEAELARLIVAPHRRDRGVGRRLARLLAGAARARGYEHVWLRVRAENAAALACYRRAGFVRAEAEDEERFNRGQPHAYVWMRATANGDDD